MAHIIFGSRIGFSPSPLSIRDITLSGIFERWQGPGDHQPHGTKTAKAEASAYIPARRSGCRGGGKKCILYPKTGWPNRSAAGTAVLPSLRLPLQRRLARGLIDDNDQYPPKAARAPFECAARPSGSPVKRPSILDMVFLMQSPCHMAPGDVEVLIIQRREDGRKTKPALRMRP